MNIKTLNFKILVLGLFFSISCFALDTDNDGIDDELDNCIEISNPDQRDSNNDGYGNLCDADLDNNDIVSFADLNLFKSAFGSNNVDADFDGNGSVSFADLNILKSLFGQPPGPAAVINNNQYGPLSSFYSGGQQNSNGFIHPGITVTQGSIDQFKTDKNMEPIKSLINNSAYFAGTPGNVKNYADQIIDLLGNRTEFNCGSYNAGDERLCNAVIWVAAGAYNLAKFYALEQNIDYAHEAIYGLEKVTTILQSIRGSNRSLISAWALLHLSRAYELLKSQDYPIAQGNDEFNYSWNSWNQAETDIRNNIFPHIIDETKWWFTGSNWDTAKCAALMSSAVAFDDRNLYNKFKNIADQLFKSYVYIFDDGDYPIMPSYATNGKTLAWRELYFYETGFGDPSNGAWRMKKELGIFTVEGHPQEYFRDLGHTGMGLDGLAIIAKMMLIQGDQIPEHYFRRLKLAYELVILAQKNEYTIPRHLPGGNTVIRNYIYAFSWIAYDLLANELAGKLSFDTSMPNLKEYLQDGVEAISKDIETRGATSLGTHTVSSSEFFMGLRGF